MGVLVHAPSLVCFSRSSFVSHRCVKHLPPLLPGNEHNSEVYGTAEKMKRRGAKRVGGAHTPTARPTRSFFFTRTDFLELH